MLFEMSILIEKRVKCIEITSYFQEIRFARMKANVTLKRYRMYYKFMVHIYILLQVDV